MNKHKQQSQGFSILIVIALLAMVAVVGFAGYSVMHSKNKKQDSQQMTSNQNRQNQSGEPNRTDATEVKLQNLGLSSFDDILYDKFAVAEYASQGRKGFYVFGDPLPGGRINPNFEYSSVKKDAKIVAAIDGVIVHINEQHENGQDDFEVFLQTSEKSIWMIGYDHLINLAVKQGDRVKVGDVLGNPGVQNNGLARFEIQVNKETGTSEHICPTTLLADSVKDATLNNLKTVMNSWEEKTGLELYNPSEQNPIGCRGKTTLTPAEAEGRQ